ncbi:hypothetical protein AAFC00_007288 [Neodothiora populina]|uniref:Proline dehydrogenase n=1 Tax=Neodothiora populina TaxID=2781224 RepID=A0ABR3PHS8_9PEZI
MKLPHTVAISSITRGLRVTTSLTASSSFAATRCLHTTKPDRTTWAVSDSSPGSPASSASPVVSPVASSQAPVLSCLPLAQVLRTYFITSVSSSPLLLQTCLKTLRAMVDSSSPVTSVEKNPLLKLILRETFYKQFCSGTSQAEIQRNVQQMRSIGYSGVILEYALEVLADAKISDTAKDVDIWRNGLLQTIDMASPGDFVGLKWSGLGPEALQLLKQQKPPSALMDDAMREVCTAAAAKRISLLPAAEETTTLPTFHSWCLNLQKDYNRGHSVVYSTYQAYLKSTPATLAKHLSLAKTEDFTLGVKLVRGAYLASEPRSIIWPDIGSTHAAYDALAEALLKKQFTGLLQPLHGSHAFDFADINLVLATHNANSVRKAQSIRAQQAAQNDSLVPLAYAQLQGMADEVSCELIMAGKANQALSNGKNVDIPRAYKCTTWGSMEECLNYLLRRAAENKDAATRTAESRAAMGAELRRRFKSAFRLI